MNNFKLRKHSVKKASFIENEEKEKKNDVEISVEGGILIPKDFENSKYLTVQLKFSVGNPEERISGPSTGSTSWNILNGNTASLTP